MSVGFSYFRFQGAMTSLQFFNMRFYGHQEVSLAGCGAGVGGRVRPAEPSTRTVVCHVSTQSRMCLATGKRQDANLSEVLRTEHTVSATYARQERHYGGLAKGQGTRPTAGNYGTKRSTRPSRRQVRCRERPASADRMAMGSRRANQAITREPRRSTAECNNLVTKSQALVDKPKLPSGYAMARVGTNQEQTGANGSNQEQTSAALLI